MPLARLRPLPIACLALAAVAAGALLVVPGCGSSDPKALNDEAARALNSGDRKGALATFEKAIEAVGANTGDPQYLRAHLGAVEARAPDDAQRASSDFLELARANPTTIDDRDYSRVASVLASAKAYDQAIAVLTQAKGAFPDSPHLQKSIDAVGDRIKNGGGSDAQLDALKGLGYLGG